MQRILAQILTFVLLSTNVLGCAVQDQSIHRLMRDTARGNILSTKPVIIIPNRAYNSGMWFRDSFWIVMALKDKQLSEGALKQFMRWQKDNGQMPTILGWEDSGNSSYRISDSKYFDDESTLLFLIWSYYNYKVFRSSIDKISVRKALGYVRAHVNDRGYYVTQPTYAPSWADSFILRQPDTTSYNQGLYAVSLKSAKALGLKVSAQEVKEAEKAYQSLYNSKLGYITFTQTLPYHDATSLYGEFLSLWLFNKKILKHRQVINTVKNLPSTPVGYKVLSNINGEYLSPNNFRDNLAPGDYQNGGSWFLHDYISLGVATIHGLPNGKLLMRQRILKEFTKDQVFHEYLQTNPALPYYKSSPRKKFDYGWNSFGLIVDEVVARLNG